MQIRQAKTDDLGFILETFLRSVRIASTHVEGVSNPVVMNMIMGLMKKDWPANVAETEGYLAGWIVFGEENRLAWIYVREMFRRKEYPDFQVAKMLLDSANIDTSKRIVTPFLPNRLKRKWEFVHRPFMVLNG